MPVGIGERLYEGVFGDADRHPVLKQASDVFAVSTRFFGVCKQEIAPAQAGFDGVGGRFLFTFFARGSGGELGVGAVGGEAALTAGGFRRGDFWSRVDGQHAASR